MFDLEQFSDANSLALGGSQTAYVTEASCLVYFHTWKMELAEVQKMKLKSKCLRIFNDIIIWK